MSEPQTIRAKGKVLWYNERGGYGFIEVEGLDKEIFMHYSKIQAEGFKIAFDGMPVELEYVIGRSGSLQATRVKSLVQNEKNNDRDDLDKQAELDAVQQRYENDLDANCGNISNFPSTQESSDPNVSN